ncbi:coiled-coil domain-containing protein 130 homolog [Penaeus japonicus]|uniref:coiled-coil domain-containing protein 130 homolog n=1 Tax=Penaeus japonicus TaxID=27405 RepID=UPI001C70C8D5|nr:coiled-coil domain-containing protein 130 homolog [Penaeus japonicus]
MGERKGVNKYYPPDYDPSKGGLNKFQGTHALRERARKLHMGILIIRFEMPYNIWCEGCENHIGTGVRYNAEKKKVGMYYSTPIYQFRMKCHLCDNHFEIKTDPANLDYVIVSGARRQERRWDPTENEQVVPEDKGVTRKMAADAMFRLEHGVDDKKQSKQVNLTLRQLEEFQTERWFDDYGANRAMRAAMRVKRNEAKAQEVKDASYNFIDPLLPPDDNDAKVAKLLQFTQPKTSDQLRDEKRTLIDAQSVFARLKAKKISPSSKKAYARQSLTGLINQSQKNFSNFKNSGAAQNLGIILKKGNPGTSSEHSPQEDLRKGEDVDPQTPASTHEDKQRQCASPESNGISGTSTDIAADSTTNQRVAVQGCSSKAENLPSQSTMNSLVGYDCSTSDSD